jgi:hypothetical protein
VPYSGAGPHPESRSNRAPTPTDGNRWLVPHTCQLAPRSRRTLGYARPRRPFSSSSPVRLVTPLVPRGHSQGGVPGHARAIGVGMT